MTVTIKIENPSASAHLTIESQDRKSAPVEIVTAQAERVRDPNASPSAEERKALAEYGEEILVHTVNGREVREPRYAAQGCFHINEWITKSLTQQNERPALPTPKGVKVTDSWEDPRPFTGVAAHGAVQLTLHDQRRFIIKCAEDVSLQVSNPSQIQSIALKCRDTKTGHVSNSSIVHPAREFQNTGAVSANKQHAAVLELLPT